VLTNPTDNQPVLAVDLVEAPGTAPGSDTLMPSGVYHHSRTKPAIRYISYRTWLLKVECGQRKSPAGVANEALFVPEQYEDATAASYGHAFRVTDLVETSMELHLIRFVAVMVIAIVDLIRAV